MPQAETSRPRIRPQALALGVIAGAFVATSLGAIRSIIETPPALGLDTTAYLEAAKRLIATGSPYAAELHDGPIVHVAENIPIAYFYPPPLAQLFVPIVGLPREGVVAVWVGLQAVLLVGLVYALVRRYHPDRSRWTALAILLAAAAFFPTQIAIYIGNVSGWIGIITAVILLAGPHGRSAAGSVAAWLKVISGALALGALVDPSTRRSAAIAIIAIPLVSVLLAPAAWVEFVAVLPNLVRTPPGGDAFNLAPTQTLGEVGLGTLVPVVAFGLPAGFLALTVINAWQGRLVPWVAAATGVYLTATATSWHQYFVVLVPLGIAIWPTASRGLRAVVVAVWVWYSVLFFAFETTPHRLLGTVLWLTMLVWVSLAADSDGRALRWSRNRGQRVMMEASAPPIAPHRSESAT